MNVFLVIVCLILVVVAVLGAVFFMLKRLKQKENVTRYVNTLTEKYNSGIGVMLALSETRDTFNAKSKEYKTITSAMFYLDYSIMRDYKTAFGMIGKTIKGKGVKEIHETILNNEKEKVMSLLLIGTSKGAENEIQL